MFINKIKEKASLTQEEETLSISLIYAIIITTFAGIAAFLFITKSSIYIRIFSFELLFIMVFILMRFKWVSINILQLISILGILVGLTSLWFDTNGLLGSIIFYYFVAITLGNALVKTSYHAKLILIHLGIITIFGIVDILFPSPINNLYLSPISEKIFNLVLIFVGTAVCGAVVTYFKFSYEKAYEKLIEKNEKLEKANEELDNLIYSISHDLRAPIASILGLIGLHKGITKDNEAIKYIELEEMALNNLDKFIEDLLAYSRVNKMEVQIEKIDLASLITEISQQVAFYHPQSVQIQLDCPILEDFYADKTKLQIVIQNLIANAINYADFSKANPYCKIHVSKIADKTQIEIEDNGMGIGESHGNKIFDIFYRANTQIKGTGLGLYIVKEAVAKMSGFINFESKLYEGTTFRIVLPNIQKK